MKLWTCIVIAFSSLVASAQDELLSFQLDAPNIDSLVQKDIWATEYYAHVTKSRGDVPYLSLEGDTLGLYSDSCDFCTSCLEGTVIIEDAEGKQHVLNYAGRAKDALINCRSCSKFSQSSLKVESWGSVRWKRSSHFGEGVKGYQLVPYRTIAVDPNYIPYGTVLYIPAAVGTAFTDSKGQQYIHDGYFFAGDTGGAIKTNHIDVYTGIDDSYPFAFVKSNSAFQVESYVIDHPELITAFVELHRSY